MRWSVIALLLTAVIATVIAIEAQPLPTFEKFPAKEKFTGKPAIPILRTRRQVPFRTSIAQGARQGPNFAGHYTVIQWRCGSDCGMMAIADAATGQVYDTLFDLIEFPPSYRYEGLPGGVVFHLDSRMLIVRGCLNRTDCAAYYFEWTPETTKLLRKVPGVPLAK